MLSLDCELLVFKAAVKLRKGDGNRATNHFVLTKVQSFFSQKKYISWIAANPCLISRVLKRLTIFVNVLGAFMEERNFGGSYSTIFADVTVFCVFKGFAW